MDQGWQQEQAGPSHAAEGGGALIAGSVGTHARRPCGRARARDFTDMATDAAGDLLLKPDSSTPEPPGPAAKPDPGPVANPAADPDGKRELRMSARSLGSNPICAGKATCTHIDIVRDGLSG